MGGINNGPGENNEEREDLRPDTEVKEADTAGLALENIGTEATLNPDDPSDPANFITAELDSQGLKNFTDSAEIRHHGAGDNHPTIMTHNMRGHGDDQLGGHISGTQVSEFLKERAIMMEQQEERRAARRVLYGNIQTMQQFEQAYQELGQEMKVLEARALVVEENVNEVQSTFDERIQKLEDSIRKKELELESLRANGGSAEEIAKLEQVITNGREQLELYREQTAGLAQEWDQYNNDYDRAKNSYDSIQARMEEAKARGQEVPPELLAELRQAEADMQTAQESLDRVERDVGYAEYVIDSTTESYNVNIDDDAYKNMSIEQLQAQRDLSDFRFNALSEKGYFSLTDQAQMATLFEATGTDITTTQFQEQFDREMAEISAAGYGVEVLEDGSNDVQDIVESAPTEAVEDRDAVLTGGSGDSALAGSAGSDDLSGGSGEQDMVYSKIVYGEEAADYLTNQMNVYQDQILRIAEQQRTSAAEVETVTTDLDESTSSLSESRATVAAQPVSPFNDNTETVQAIDTLAGFYGEREAELTQQHGEYSEQITTQQAQLDALRASSAVTPEQLREMEQGIAALELKRDEVQQELVDTRESQEVGQSVEQQLHSNAEASTSSCMVPAAMAKTLAEAEAVRDTHGSGLSPEERIAEIQRRGQEAADARWENTMGGPFNLDGLAGAEVIGSAERAESGLGSADAAQSTQWDSAETRELTTSEQQMRVGAELAAKTENGQLTLADLDRVLESNPSVDRETIERDLAAQGIEVLKPDDGMDPTNSIFVDGAEPAPEMASYASLGPAPAGAIQVPRQNVAAPTVTPEPIGPSNFASFADTELNNYGPPLAGDDAPVNNRAPEQGVGATAFNSTPAAGQTAATTPPAAGTAQPDAPAASSNDTSAAQAIAQREAELLAAEQARLAAQQNNDSPGGAPPGAGGGSTIT